MDDPAPPANAYCTISILITEATHARRLKIAARASRTDGVQIVIGGARSELLASHFALLSAQ
jgi:hypothetical protein